MSIHTCHADCPCHRGDQPLSDFMEAAIVIDPPAKHTYWRHPARTGIWWVADSRRRGYIRLWRDPDGRDGPGEGTRVTVHSRDWPAGWEPAEPPNRRERADKPPAAQHGLQPRQDGAETTGGKT